MIEFIKYDGEYPNLCFGTLSIKINGDTYHLDNVLVSGGCICRNENWDMWADRGPWSVDLDDHPELQQYKEDITRIVNENVPFGCCGGCI